MAPGIEEQVGRLQDETVALFRAGRYREAVEPARLAADLCREHLSPDHPRRATSVNNLGALYRELGDLQAAEPCLREAVEIDRRTRGAHDPSLAVSLNQLGIFYKTMGDYAQAEPLYRESLEIRRRTAGEESEEFATSLNNLALLYDALGDYPAAEPLLRQALEIDRRRVGEWHPAFAESLNNLAGLCYESGRYAEAEPLYRRALEVLRGTVGEGHPRVALALQNLAGVYRALQDYAEAGSLYHQAYELLRRVLGEIHPRTIDSLRSLGIFYAETAQLEAAAAALEQALELGRQGLGAEATELIPTLVSLANVRTGQRRYDEARDLLTAVQRLSQRAWGRDHLGALEGLGGIARETARLGEAEALFTRVLEGVRRAHGAAHLTSTRELQNLALVQAAAGKPEQALALLLEAAGVHDRLLVEAFRIGSEAHRMQFLNLVQNHLRLLLSLVVGQLQADRSAVAAAFDLLLRRKGLGLEALGAQRDAVLGGKYPHLQERLRLLTNLRRQLARARLEGAGDGEGEAAAERRRQVSEWEAQAHELERELARQIPEMGLAEKLRAADRQAVALAMPTGAALVEFVRYLRYDFLAATRGESGWGARFDELAAGERRLEALASVPAAYVAVILPAGAPEEIRLVDLGAAEPIDAMIASFRAAITGDPETRAARDLGALPAAAQPAVPEENGEALQNALLAPLAAALAGRTRLLLAPDGELCRLPFEVLPLPQGGRAIDVYEFLYLGCGRDVLRWGQRGSGEAAPPVVAANPDFDLGSSEKAIPPAPSGRGVRWPWSRAATEPPLERASRAAPVASRDSRAGRLRAAGISFTPLPGTRLEGERIADLLGSPVWMGGEATEGRLKAVASPRILHIATHGFFLSDAGPALDGGSASGPGAAEGQRLLGRGGENPLLRSGLALAGANTWLRGGAPPTEAEDGILTAEDVSGLDLLATDLVVLSACETGLGEVRAGEGVFGLRRAFTVAGAKTLVISLWKVPDQQTQELMEAFYRALLAGRPRAAALREAQLELKRRHPEPVYWGAFICEGNPAALPPP